LADLSESAIKNNVLPALMLGFRYRDIDIIS